jgi:trehalose/maltose hydrolase-like predicted phosphorylase
LNIKEEDYENFSKIARSLKLLYDEERDFHPQFEGYLDLEGENVTIKQADVVLVGFPLQLPMDE